MLRLFVLSFLLMTHAGLASTRQMIDTLGASPKGQYVALEEYGYKLEKHAYYVTIRIMNVWKKEYVGTPVVVEVPAYRPDHLQKARDKARDLAEEDLIRFQISG